MSTDWESIIHELPHDDPRQSSKSEVSMITEIKVTKIVLLCYQQTKTSINICPATHRFIYSYIWSKFTTSQLYKTFHPHLPSYSPLWSVHCKYFCCNRYEFLLYLFPRCSADVLLTTKRRIQQIDVL